MIGCLEDFDGVLPLSPNLRPKVFEVGLVVRLLQFIVPCLAGLFRLQSVDASLKVPDPGVGRVLGTEPVPFVHSLSDFLTEAWPEILAVSGRDMMP